MMHRYVFETAWRRFDGVHRSTDDGGGMGSPRLHMPS